MEKGQREVLLPAQIKVVTQNRVVEYRDRVVTVDVAALPRLAPLRGWLKESA